MNMDIKNEKRDNDPDENYINTLNKKEKMALDIAKKHLGSSFDLKKSIGYLNYKNEIEKKIQEK